MMNLGAIQVMYWEIWGNCRNLWLQPVKFRHFSYRTVGEGGGQTVIIEIVISDNVDNMLDSKSPCFFNIFFKYFLLFLEISDLFWKTQSGTQIFAVSTIMFVRPPYSLTFHVKCSSRHRWKQTISTCTLSLICRQLAAGSHVGKAAFHYIDLGNIRIQTLGLFDTEPLSEKHV